MEPGIPPSTPDSPTSPSIGFNTDQLPHTHTSRASDDEASVDPDIIRDEPEPEEDEDGEDLYNDNFLESVLFSFLFFFYSMLLLYFV